MKASRLILILIVGAILLYQHFAPVSSDAVSVSSSAASATDAMSAVPKKAFEVLDIVRQTGRAPDGYVGGRVFQNREHRLPEDGNYREFDVDPHDGNRNAERLIVEWDTKKAWYTGDHYQTFVPMP